MIDLKKTLATGGTAVGTWVTMNHPVVAEIFARAGFDWLVVDLEHTNISIAGAGDLIRVIELAGAFPMVRLSKNEPVQIKRVMDSGARGLVVPMVNSAQDARDAVAAMQYPPYGTRGVGLYRAQGYGTCFADYKAWLPGGAVCIAQIEHIEAVRNLEEILAVDGIDGYMIGPYDLSASMGIPGEFDHPDFLAAIDRIRQVGPASGKAPGIHIIEPVPAQLTQRLDEGYRFVAYSLDTRMLDATARTGLAVRAE